MSRALFLGIALLAAGLGQAAAQEAPPALRGRSMVGDRVERITFASGSFDQHWIVKLYFARDGRIFAKQTLNSGNPKNASGTLNLISGRQGSAAPFTWNGSDVRRQWTNPSNGVVLRLVLSPQPGGKGCAMDLERENIHDFTVQTLRQSCRLFSGNAAAD